MIFENVGVGMSDKKIKKKLVNFIEECIERYIDEHLVDLKRKILNLDGFKSEDEYKNLQARYDELNDKIENLQTSIGALNDEKNAFKQKNEFLQSEVEAANKKRNEQIWENDRLVAENNEIRTEKEELEKKLAECEENLKVANEVKDKAAEKISIINQVIVEDRKTIDRMKQEIVKYQETIDYMEQKIYKKRMLLDYFTAGYGEIDNMYKIYQQLDENIHEELSGIFGSADTPIQFFCGALQENHLDNFWEYICSKINSGKIDKDTEGMLNNLFDFCFDMVNTSQPKPMYKRLQVQAGFDFDNNYMIKTSSSSQLGIIKEIKLEGYVYASSNKVVKRSLVQVESED